MSMYKNLSKPQKQSALMKTSYSSSGVSMVSKTPSGTKKHHSQRTCDRRWISQLFCGCWLRSGVATPPRRPWQCRNFNERSCCYLVAWPWLGGAYLRDKNTCARTSTENVGGLMREGGRICGTLRYSLKRRDMSRHDLALAQESQTSN